MRVPDHRRLAAAQIAPALERREVAIDRRSHHLADLERLLAIGVVLGAEDLADGRETRAALRTVRVVAHVAIARIGRLRAPREPFPRRDVAVIVMAKQDLQRLGDAARPVLRLAVRAHDAVVAADAFVVLGGDAPGILEGLLPGEHHGRSGGHHQDPLGVHEHGRFGVPVRLRADGDSQHHHVDLASPLGELDDPAQDARDPVHVLGAARHRDLRARAHLEPFHRGPELLRQIESGGDAPAFGLGDRSHLAAGIAEQHHPLHAFRVPPGEVAHHADHHVGGVASGRPLHGNQRVRGVQIVFDEFARRRGGVDSGRLRQHPYELEGMDQPAAAKLDHLLLVLRHRLQRLFGGLVPADAEALARCDDAQECLAQLPGPGIGHARGQGDHLQPQALGGRSEPGGDALDLLARQIEGRRERELHAIPFHPLVRRPLRLVDPHPSERLVEDALQFGKLDDVAGHIADRREIADLGHGEEALVLGIRFRDAPVEVEVVRRRQPRQIELREPRELESLEQHRVRAAEAALLAPAAGTGTEGEVLRRLPAAFAQAACHHHRDPSRRTGERRLQQDVPQRIGDLVGRAPRTLLSEVQVEQDLALLGHVAREPRKLARTLRDAGGRSRAGEEPVTDAAKLVIHPRARDALDVGGGHPFERPEPVIAADQRFHEPGPERRRFRCGDMRDERRRNRLRAGDQPVEDRLPLVAGGIGKAREIALRPLQRFSAHPVQRRLVEIPVPRFAGEIGDCREALVSEVDQPVERLSRSPAFGGQRIVRGEPALEDRRDGSRLLAHPLPGFLDAEEGQFQIAARRIHRDAVLRERRAQQRDERRGKPRAAGFRLVQVAPELFEGRRRAALEGRLAAEERLEIHERAERGVLGSEDSGIVARSSGGELAPAHREPARLGRRHVESEQELLEPCERGEISGSRFRAGGIPLAAQRQR